MVLQSTLLTTPWDGGFNLFFSLALLVGLVWTGRCWWNSFRMYRQWNQQWVSWESHQWKHLNTTPTSDSISSWLEQTGWLSLLDYAKAGLPFPSAQESSRAWLQTRLHQEERWCDLLLPEASSRPSQLTRMALLFGIFGTFLSLISVLQQPSPNALIHGELSQLLQQLTGGIQTLFPQIARSFWPLSCGCFLALVVGLQQFHKRWMQETQAAQLKQFQKQLADRLLLTIYPWVSREAPVLARDASLQEMQAQLPTPLPKPSLEPNVLLDAIAPLADELQRQTQQLQLQHETLQHLSKQQENEEELISKLHKTLQETLGSLHQTLATSPSSTEPIWQESWDLLSKKIGESLDPIAQTEHLLSERIAGISRGHIALVDAITQLEEHEKQLPDKLKQVLQQSLRPAHALLQRHIAALGQLFEKQLQQQNQEREEWRSLLQQFHERFAGLDRLSHSNTKLTHELGRVADTLLEISTRLRFVPLQHEGGDQNREEILEAEINQLLNVFEDDSQS